ncbi:unnamed protein product [Effrenium voratum]|nr:unnamed protein product [Effrenium voratum]
MGAAGVALDAPTAAPDAPTAPEVVPEVVCEATVNSIRVQWKVQLDPRVHAVPVKAELTPCPVPQGSERMMPASGPEGAISGTCDFHFLYAGQDHTFRLFVGEGEPGTFSFEGAARPTLELRIRTAACGAVEPRIARMLPADMWPTYVGPEHELGEWLGLCPEDMVWTFSPSFDVLRSLWLNACFTLPSRHSPIAQCPNPIRRYCLDLTKRQPWLRNKKVRRHKSDFRLTVNANFRATFQQCERTHREAGRGSWITPDLIEGLDRCRKEDGELKVYSIELWEKSTGQLAAAIMALSVGDIFHDYTTATMLRDGRSPGAILTKVVGHLLTEAGYTLWYWGFKNPYMGEYDGQYGGLELRNDLDFWPRWRQAREMSCLPGNVDLAKRVPPGGGASHGGLDLAVI